MAEEDGGGTSHNPLGDPFGTADKLFGKPVEEKFRALDPEKRFAWSALFGAAAVGVVGVPLLTVILDQGGAPTAKNIAASFWLFVITLPVAAAVALAVYICMSPPKAGPAQLLGACALLALGAVTVMNGAIESAGGSLADFYCYNDGLTYENACRAFDEQGLADTPVGSPAQNAQFLANVLVLITLARGWVMVACGIVAGWAAGYLARRAADGS